MCWEILTLAQVHSGQVHNSLRSGRRALALSQEIKNVLVQINSMNSLAYGLVDAGAYEEALKLTQHAVTLARTFPLKLLLCFILATQGSVYQALQQWEEAQAALEEELAVAETIGFRSLRTSRLCMNCAVTGEWEQAYRYALETVTLRKRRMDAALFPLDFYSHYETEALLHAGDESQARAAVQRLGEGLGPNPRFRLPYLRSLAVLAAWEGNTEQAVDHLREAAGLAADLGLPAEQWQIQAALGSVYETAGEQAQARSAFGEAARIIQGLAEGIKDETLRARFLAGPQIQPVVQHAQSEASPVPQDQAEPGEAPRRLVLQADEPWEAS
jgi:tetratricopeptide (TPR) repeat protein